MFCLGIFLIPKDNFYAQFSKENCCKNNSKKDCCKTKHKESKEEKNTCTDDCCSSCIACFTFIETPSSKNLYLELTLFKSNKNSPFEYSDPYISDRLKEIWQPPKLG